MQFRNLILTCLLFAFTGCDYSKSKSDLPPYRITFGVFQNGQLVEVEGNRVPFRPGTEYGWVLELENPKGTVVVREVLTLPSPTAWKFDNEQKAPDEVAGVKNERVKIKESGQVFSKEMEVTAKDDVAHLSTYKILASDPLGTYRMELFLDEQPAAILEFTLVKEKPEKKVRLSWRTMKLGEKGYL